MENNTLISKEIKTMELFSTFDPEEIEQIVELMQPVKVTEGECLIQIGQTANLFYINLNAHFMISFKDGRAFTLHKKGDIIGMATMLAPYQYKGAAVALTNGDVLSINGDDFLRLIQSNTNIGDKIMQKIKMIFKDHPPKDEKEVP